MSLVRRAIASPGPAPAVRHAAVGRLRGARRSGPPRASSARASSSRLRAIQGGACARVFVCSASSRWRTASSRGLASRPAVRGNARPRRGSRRRGRRGCTGRRVAGAARRGAARAARPRAARRPRRRAPRRCARRHFASARRRRSRRRGRDTGARASSRPASAMNRARLPFHTAAAPPDSGRVSTSSLHEALDLGGPLGAVSDVLPAPPELDPRRRDPVPVACRLGRGQCVPGEPLGVVEAALHERSHREQSGHPGSIERLAQPLGEVRAGGDLVVDRPPSARARGGRRDASCGPGGPARARRTPLRDG